MKYALKSSLVDVEVAKENGILETETYKLPYSEGERILTYMNGQVEVISEALFNKRYVPVKEVVIKEIRVKHKSPFEEQYELALMNFNLDSQLEDQEYIQGTQKLANNK